MPYREVLDKWTSTKRVKVKKSNKKLPLAGHVLLFGNIGFITNALDQDDQETVEETVYMVRLKRKEEDGGNFTREADKSTWDRLKIGGQMYSLS